MLRPYRHSRRSWLIALPGLAAAIAGGCAPFQTPDDLPARLLPAARMAPDSVILEVGYAQLPLSDQAGYDEVWQQADEQALAIDLRQELARNGLRCGILGKRIPERIRTLMDQKPTAADQQSEDLDAGEIAVDRQSRRLQCRTGRRAKILCSKTFAELSLLLRDGQAVRGQQLQNAQCLLALKPYPQGDGRVQIDLLPEVEHGKLEMQWVAGEGNLMQRVGRKKVEFDALRISLSLAPGQMIVVSALDPPLGLGEHFFVESVGGTPSRSLVFIRLAHTQHDNLFAPELSAQPLATPGNE